MAGLSLGLGFGLQRPAGAGQAALEISGTPVLTATEDAAYAGFVVSASGGVPPYSYSLVGSWPTGLSINATSGAVSGTPTVPGNYAGLSVRVTDNEATTADLSTFTLAVENTPDAPVNTALPVISGNRWIGETLSVSNGSWDDNGSAISGYTYQWKRNGANISGAAAATYRLTSDDADATISCSVTATNAGGSAAATATGVQAMAAALEFLEGRTSTTSGTVTHSNVNFGAAPPAGENRFIIAAIAFSDLSTARTVTSVTIGGVAATRLVRSDGDSSFASAELWVAEVPSGTSGSIVVAGLANRSAIAAYRLTNVAGGAAVHTATIAASQNGPANLTVVTGDLVLACTAIPSPGNITWTGITEDYDVSAGSSHQGSTAKTAAAATGTLAVNSSPLSGRRLAAAAFFGPNRIEEVSALKSAIFIRPDETKISVAAVKSAVFVKPV